MTPSNQDAAGSFLAKEFKFGLFLWKASDLSFKFVGWCLVLGAVRYVYQRTHDRHLGALQAVLGALLLTSAVMVVRPVMIAATLLVGTRAIGAWPAKARIALSVVVVPLLVGAAVLVGLSAVESSVSILSSLH